MKRRFRGSNYRSRDKRKRRPNKFRPRVESLEPRILLTGLTGPSNGLILPILPSLNNTIAVEQTTTTVNEPRQLPGSSLRQLPPSALYSIEPVILAGDPNGTPPDTPADRVDPNTPTSLYAGVGSLTISGSICTATAISPIHVLTAAHCLDPDANGSINPSPGDVSFHVNIGPGPDPTYEISANQLYVHPDWTGFDNPSVNDDIAVVELSSELPSDVPIYPLNDVPFDDTVSAYFAGYGRSGDGINGYTTSRSLTVKRWGMNDIDFYFVDDEGSGVRETFQFDFDAPGSGDSLGNDLETTLGGGDSGGPSFIEDANGDLKIFGVNTFVTQFETNTPAVPFFGSGGGGMVVAAYLDFIDSVINGDQVVISETDDSTIVSEAGNSDTYTVVLSKAPSHSTVVDISGGDQVLISPTQLTFTTDNWDVPQEVLVQASDDTVIEGPHVEKLTHTVSSADLAYDDVAVDSVVVDIIDDEWSLETTPYVDLGTSDNVAWDQPRVSVELLTDDQGSGSVGPTVLNTWLLDTGANTTIAFRSAVEDMKDPPHSYQTEGKFVEFGVAGDHIFDISADYRFDFAGNSGIRNTLLNERIISDPVNDISIFGPFGIVGMPAMNNHATTFDFSGWTTIDISSDLLMRVDFADAVPPDDGNRYSLPMDKRLTFSPDEQVIEGDHPPMWADVPFMTAIPVHNGNAAAGNFIYDSGAQVSVMSTRLAEAIGLDSNGDGLLDENDANFARYETVGGIGGTIDAPVFLFDEVRLPTEQGVDIAWTDLQWLVIDIFEGLDGVIGFDLMTSGWIEAFAINGQSGYIMQAQLDFLDWDTTETGAVHLDLNPEYNQVIDPQGPGAKIIATGGATTVSESGVDDTYGILLTQPPTENVTITLDVDTETAPTQLVAVDNENPGNDFLVFTPDNWYIPQVVRVSAINDATIENFHRSSVRHVSSSASPDYTDVGMPRVTTNIIDDDYPGVMIIPSDGETLIVEGGSTDTYQVVLTYPPGEDVTFRIEHDQGQLTAVDQANPLHRFLTFTPENWNVRQTVLVTAIDDGVVEGNHEAFISHFLESTDPNYAEAFALQELVTIRETEYAEVVDRHVFYDHAGSPLFDSGAYANSAIDSTKQALLPGQTSTYANYTNYVRGLNGLIVDVEYLPGNVSASDFEFATWNGIAAEGFVNVTPQVTVTTWPVGGKDDSTRIKLEFPDNTIQNTWLRVTMLANDNTGLFEDDLFYVGNAIADFDVGNLGTLVRVNASDTVMVRLNQSILINSVDVDNIYDINKDGRVNASDTVLTRLNQASQVIRHFDAP